MSDHDFDMRTSEVQRSKFSYYVWDDLRCQEKGVVRNLYYYDTLDQAIEKYLSLPEGMTPALGFSDNHRSSELDLVHRKEGEHVLLRDFMDVTDTRFDLNIHEMCAELCEKLNIQWESDFMLGNSILIPRSYALNVTGPSAFYDPYFNDKRLDYLVYDEMLGLCIPRPGGLVTAIEEAYLLDEGKIGYVPFKEFMGMVNESRNGFLSEHRPRVNSFYINYIDAKGHFGGADVTPHTLRVLLEREAMLERPDPKNLTAWTVKPTALESFARLLDDFAYTFDSYEYADTTQRLPDGCPDREGNVNSLISDLFAGKTSGIREYFVSIAEDGDAWSLIAKHMLAKLDAIEPVLSKQKLLEQMVEHAKPLSERANHSLSHPDKEKERE